MTSYLSPAYTFNGQIGYSREEIDKALNRKANLANILNKLEVLERFSVVNADINGLDARITQLIDDINNGVINTTPVGTTVDGQSVNIFLKRFGVAFQRPVPSDLNLGELAVSYNENSPHLFLKDSNGVIRRIGNIQFGTSLPDGTAYNQANPATYPEQRTRGELFYETGSGYLYVWSGTSWNILSYGTDALTTSNIVTQVSANVDLEDLQDVTPNGSKAANDVLRWNGSTFVIGAPLITSVNTKTGAVVINPDDLNDASTTNKFTTAAEKSKLAGIEAGATADQTPTEIRNSLQSLTGTNRLDASAIKNLPGGGGSFVDSVNGLTGTVTLTTNNIADTATNSYVQTVLSGVSKVLITDNAGNIVDLDPPSIESSLTYNALTGSIEWVKKTVKSLDRIVGAGTYVLVKEMGFYDPSGGSTTVNLPGSGDRTTGEFHFIKNFGASGTVLVPDVSETLNPGQQVSVVWDSVSWQII